jgi:ribosomal protein L40E
MALAFGGAIGMLILGLVAAIPVMMILRAWLVEGTLDFGMAMFSIVMLLALLGLTWNSQGTVWMLVFVVLLLGACIALPFLGGMLNARSMKVLEDEDITKYRRAIEHDPDNASAYAFLGDALMKRGSYVAAISQYERAMDLNPRFESCKHKLERARQAADGMQYETRVIVCENCKADNPASNKNCARCGTTLQMGFSQWITKRDNAREVARVAVPTICVAIALVTIVSSLPTEWKGCVLCAAAIIGGWYGLRSMAS